MPDSQRRTIDSLAYAPGDELIEELVQQAGLDRDARARITASAAELVRAIRGAASPGLMEVFLAEYGLSTEEGIALMCLAEALLRVPDEDTIDALIEDKIAPSDWGRHRGQSTSSLVNASTWALMLTGQVLDDREPGVLGTLRGALKRLGEPVIRAAVARAMREMGNQFVLGEDIGKAMKRARGMEAKGYSYSYDMLGEAARTDADARRYQMAYAGAITQIARACGSDDIRENPGISVKLSALHPRYERAKKARVMDELVPRLRALASLARAANMGLNIDAEEADRLSLSLDVIEAVLSDPALAGWDGFGVVVQAYGQRAGAVIDWLYALAERLDRKIMVRLVKGAYWDSEIKRAQVAGLEGFPVFTSKAATDVSYIANAAKLLNMRDRIYPQFATHNAHTVAAVLEMAGNARDFEFQRLHGMGERLHDIVLGEFSTRCRIYAPVGAHRDLLAYLVRRLLENGANSSFVNQIVNEDVAPETVAADPFEAVERMKSPITAGPELFAPARRNSAGWDLAHDPHLDQIEAARAPHAERRFTAEPVISGTPAGGAMIKVENPARPGDIVGDVTLASATDVETALGAAAIWDAPAQERAKVLNRAADLYEAHLGPFFALLAREAGKTLPDCLGELREAVDFLRYYASQAEGSSQPRGLFACISPWNFPLAIFTGQIAGALAAGNAVLAKPAEQTPLIAYQAITLLHQAGVPREVLQLLPGDGPTVGAALTSDARIKGVAFTGSTETAQTIRRAMAANCDPDAPLIAETGGLNAMIVDSTALPEQAVRDVLASAFQSAGQRCSALRCLYVQEDIAEDFMAMLKGAVRELAQGDPWQLAADLGPVIDDEAAETIRAYIEQARSEGRVIHENPAPKGGHFIAPTILSVKGISEMEREVFGPVLHVATFAAEQIDRVIADINATGYGLTFGLHSRIDDRVQHVVESLAVGNIYVNRNQIGAVVGSQPFGGEGLSGTGPKAGGPDYLTRFSKEDRIRANAAPEGRADVAAIRAALAQVATAGAPLSTKELPGPTGELNRLSTYARLPFLCLGPGPEAAHRQLSQIEAAGGRGIAVTGLLPPEGLSEIEAIGGAVWWGDDIGAREIAKALARRKGPILPLVTGPVGKAHVRLERHLCVDTTASGGNAALLAQASGA